MFFYVFYIKLLSCAQLKHTKIEIMDNQDEGPILFGIGNTLINCGLNKIFLIIVYYI